MAHFIVDIRRTEALEFGRTVGAARSGLNLKVSRMFIQLSPKSGSPPRWADRILIQWISCMLLFLVADDLRAGESAPLSEFQSKTWRVEDGLPQSTVTCISQSSDGFLWLGTQNGLVRFDGVKFQVFDENNTPAIKNSRIVQLLSTDDGTLWVGTEHGGLLRLRDGQFAAFETRGRGTTHEYAHNFCGDHDGALWEVSCEWQLIKFLNGQSKVDSDDWNLSSRAVHALACDDRGRIWVGTTSELAVLQNGRFQSRWGQTNEAGFQVDFLASSRSGGVWAAANNQLRKFAEGRWTADLGSYSWTNRPIYDLYEDAENRLWVAILGDGLFRYETNGQMLHVTSHNGLPTDFVRCVMEDKEGNIWAGTEGGGLCRLKRPKFQTLGSKQGLASDQVMAVAGAQDGGVWIGTDGDGLDHCRNGEIQHYGANQGLKNGHVWSVVQDHGGTVWAGTWDGLYKWDGASFSGLSDGQTIGWQVLAIFEDSKSNLWIGQQAFGGITRLHNSERTVVEIPGTSATLDVRAIVEDHDGNLWVGTSEDGLYRMRDGKFTHFGRKDGLESDSIWCLYVDGEGTLWVGSCRGGLSRWQNGHFKTWSTKNGLLNNVICQIQDDSLGNLWLGSYGGVFRVSKKELAGSGSVEPLRCAAFTLEDGLPSVECQGGFQPSSYKSPDGRLWFPTTKGVVVVDPATVGWNTLPPTVVIEDVLTNTPADSQPSGYATPTLTLPRIITLAPGNRRVEFQYTALSFAAPYGVRFKYRLENLDKDWEDAGTKRTAVYSRIPPGNYQFHVIACNEDGVWNNTGATIEIAAAPYFWETKWFLGLTTAGGLAAILSTVRYSERRRVRRRLEQAERERAVERERSRIARDIHDDLGANLTEIALLSEFAQEPSASPAQVLADMQKITAKARSLTRRMDEVVWAVNPTNDSLEKFVTYTCNFAEEYLKTAKIACRLEVPEFLPEILLTAEVRHNLFLTVKEALNNIVKHAAATEVMIQIAIERGKLILMIRDNGKGFAQDSATNCAESSALRNGLPNMRKRIESIAGMIEWESLPERGAAVKLTIDLGR